MQLTKKQTYSKRIYSIDELHEYLSSIPGINEYSFVSYMYQEYGFFPIYFNELFEEFFFDCQNDLSIGACFAGHEIFYEEKVDILLILDSFMDTTRAYKDGQKTQLHDEISKKHQNGGIAFWFTVRNFDEDEFQKVIDQFSFKRELFAMGKKKLWQYGLHPGPRKNLPYQYARGEDDKEYWLPENITHWQTHRTLGWNLDKWQKKNHFPKVMFGDYDLIFVKHSYKTLDEDGTKRFGFIDNVFLQELINAYTQRKRRLIILHDLAEYAVETNEYIQEVRMKKYFDTKFFLSLVDNASTFISSSTSPIDLAAYYCDTNLILLDDRAKKIDWVKKVSDLRNKQCLACGSRKKEDAHKAIEFIGRIALKDKQKNRTFIGPRQLNIGGTEKTKGWEILNGLDADYVDHVGEASDLSRFKDKTFDAIYSSHTLEHVSYWNDLVPTLKEWRRVLKDNGEILISVPDLDVLCRLFSSPDMSEKRKYNLMRIIYGGQYHEYDFHYGGFNLSFMKHFANLADLTVKKKVKRFDIFQDTSNSVMNGELISLNVVLGKK